MAQTTKAEDHSSNNETALQTIRTIMVNHHQSKTIVAA
jgi:hypothetical protein